VLHERDEFDRTETTAPRGTQAVKEEDMSRTAIGVFATGEAERVLDELVSRGFRAEGISLLSLDESAIEGREVVREVDIEMSGPFAGLAGHLLGLHSANLSGIGAAIVAGPIAQAVEQSPSEAEESLFVALVEEGVPEGTARAYTDEVCRGAALVAIRVPDQDLASALDVLKRHHARAAEETAAREEPEPIDGAKAEGAEAKEGVKAKASEAFEGLKAKVGGAKAKAAEAFEGIKEKAEVKREEGGRRTDDLKPKGERSVSPPEQTERMAGDMSMPVMEEEVFEREEVIEPHAKERVSSAIESHEPGFREHFAGEYGKESTEYKRYSPAYRYGYKLRHHAGEQSWSGVESRAKSEWEAANPNTWEKFKSAIRHAWMKATGKTED
jgi:hypothetical protein